MAKKKKYRYRKNIDSHRKRRRRRRINGLQIIALAIIIVCVAALGVAVKNVLDLRNEQKDLQEQNEALNAKKLALQEEFQKVNEKDYIINQARKQLKLILPGEKLYIISGEDEETEDGE